MIDGKIKTVGDIIEELKQFPSDMMVFTYNFDFDDYGVHDEFSVPYFSVQKVENQDEQEDDTYTFRYLIKENEGGIYSPEPGTPFLQIG
mgnify:CR=1 FL=1